jgi:hypothetical protein
MLSGVTALLVATVALLFSTVFLMSAKATGGNYSTGVSAGSSLRERGTCFNTFFGAPDAHDNQQVSTSGFSTINITTNCSHLSGAASTAAQADLAAGRAEVHASASYGETQNGSTLTGFTGGYARFNDHITFNTGGVVHISAHGTGSGGAAGGGGYMCVGASSAIEGQQQCAFLMQNGAGQAQTLNFDVSIAAADPWMDIHFIVDLNTELIGPGSADLTGDVSMGLSPGLSFTSDSGAFLLNAAVPTDTPVAPTSTSTSTDITTSTPIPPTETPTETSTHTPVPPTNTATSTITSTPTNSPTDTRTYTPVPPTSTPTVVNSAPILAGMTCPADAVLIGTPLTTSTGFTDPNGGDTHIAVWNWGDGTSSQGSMSEAGGAGSTSASHTYTEIGVYTIAVTVTDNHGGSGSLSCQYAVIYDPSGGHINGQGRVSSPPGAYRPDPALTGEVRFGFVSNYQNGAQAPDGHTTFDFRARNLEFKSVSYDWLIISGYRARYQGVGRINNAGNYGFMVSLVDGNVSGGGGVDKFRIKIWDRDNANTTVYDNQLGSPDSADPTRAIEQGSLTIHR